MAETDDHINPPQEGEHLLRLRNLRLSDLEGMAEITTAIYGDISGVWGKEHISKLLQIFPEGQIAIEDKGKLVGFALSIIVDDDKLEDQHTYREVTGNYTFSTHDPNGDVLYGVDIMVHPDYQGLRLGRRIYDARKAVCEQLNLSSIVAGGRMPNYHKYEQTLTPREYINKVAMKEIYDPVLSFQMSNGFQVKRVLRDYLPYDQDSRAFATLIEWNNIYYEKKRQIVGGRTPYVRIGLVQWQMRNVSDLNSLFDNVEYFVDSVSHYNADFLLLPELFNTPLMAEFNEDDPAVAIRKLAGYTEQIREKLVEFAVSYNINIIGGSMPLYEDNVLYNVAYLCRRNGTWDTQYKIHPTPSEVSDWGVSGGNMIKLFDTDRGKIGILVCYDAEFPELSRILAEQGMQILFVPFSTDTQNGYQRVRICSQARAIENECYVAIAGSVGNLPKVRNMDIQYAQSAVFSPSDFAFPQNAIIAEGTPNTEMTIIADVDLDHLKELHAYGSVRNLKDRRTDLYEVRLKK